MLAGLPQSCLPSLRQPVPLTGAFLSPGPRPGPRVPPPALAGIEEQKASPTSTRCQVLSPESGLPHPTTLLKARWTRAGPPSSRAQDTAQCPVPVWTGSPSLAQFLHLQGLVWEVWEASFDPTPAIRTHSV